MVNAAWATGQETSKSRGLDHRAPAVRHRGPGAAGDPVPERDLRD